MFARVEVTLKPDLPDHTTTPLLRRIETADPELRRAIRWARKLDVYWLDLPMSREELILALNEVVWDPVLNWLFTGNLIPSAAGSRGGLEDLLETSPNRPGQFHAIEKRLRPGVNDYRARTLLEDFEVTLRRKLPDARISSGALLILEGTALGEERLSTIAREYFANEVQESWTVVPAREFSNSERFFAERVKREMPRAPARTGSGMPLAGAEDREVADADAFRTALARRGFPLTAEQYGAISTSYSEHEGRAPYPLELELAARALRSRTGRSAAFDAELMLSEEATQGLDATRKSTHLFQDTFLQSSKDNPRSWMLTNFERGRPALLGVDEEEALIVHAGLVSDSLERNAFGEGARAVASVIGQVVAEEKGARPLLIQNLITGEAPDRGVVARRVFDGLKTGIARTSLELGVPVLGGSLEVGYERRISPSVGVFAVGSLPRSNIDLDREFKRAEPGEKIYLLASPFDESVQVSFDALVFKRMLEFILEGSERNYFLSHTYLGDRTFFEGALEFAERLGGAEIALDRVLRRAHDPAADVTRGGAGDTERTNSRSSPAEFAGAILRSQRLERFFLRVNSFEVNAAQDLAARRGVSLIEIGQFAEGSRLAFRFGSETVARMDPAMGTKLFPATPKRADWRPPARARPIVYGSVKESGLESLLKLLSHPNLSSREWLSLEFDQEVQGSSILKPFHFISPAGEAPFAGPNDGICVRSKPLTAHGIVAALGSHARWMELDPYVAGLMSVDEVVRNALACGADYGKEDSLFALSYLLQMPVLPPALTQAPEGETETETERLLNGAVARLAFGAYVGSKELELPFVSGVEAPSPRPPAGQNATLALTVQSLSKVSKVAGTRSADFKAAGDQIYLLGHAQFSLLASALAEVKKGLPEDCGPPQSDWSTARRLYSWLGGAIGKEQKKLRSIHDVSDGGLLTAVSESLLARGFGATIQFPEGLSETMEWEFLYGEGFHGMIVSMAETEVALVEAEWLTHEIPFCRLGQVLQNGVLQVKRDEKNLFAVETKVLRQAWKKEGYWE